jgi:hypothetical protein
MVASDHHGANAGTPRPCDRVLCLGARRIDDAYQPCKREIVLETFVRMRGLFRKRFVREPSAGDTERSQCLAREGFVGLEDACSTLIGERPAIVANELARASC